MTFWIQMEQVDGSQIRPLKVETSDTGADRAVPWSKTGSLRQCYVTCHDLPQTDSTVICRSCSYWQNPEGITINHCEACVRQ